MPLTLALPTASVAPIVLQARNVRPLVSFVSTVLTCLDCACQIVTWFVFSYCEGDRLESRVHRWPKLLNVLVEGKSRRAVGGGSERAEEG